MKRVLKESTLKLNNGLTLCVPREPENGEFYINFLDTDTGEEYDEGAAYWDVDEWAQGDEICLGAIFACIMGDNIDVEDIDGDLNLKLNNNNTLIIPSYEKYNDGVNTIEIIDEDGNNLNTYTSQDFLTNPDKIMANIIDCMIYDNPDASTREITIN